MDKEKGDLLRWAELFSRYNAQATRRDKWFRLAQYISRFAVLHLTDTRTGKETVIGQLKSLESNLADGRKLFRIFGSTDFLLKAIDLYRNPGPSQSLNALAIIANVCKALWLVHDHFSWLGKIGLLQVNKDRLTKNGAICWTVALACLIIRDLKQITELEVKHAAGDEESEERVQNEKLHAARMELFRDFLDLMLPLGTLGRVSPKLSAACGILSTLISIKQEYAKLI